jgi:hypothetical protein
MEDITVTLSEGEVRLILDLIQNRDKVFPYGIPNSYGPTRVGVKMLDAQEQLAVEKQGRMNMERIG